MLTKSWNRETEGIRDHLRKEGQPELRLAAQNPGKSQKLEILGDAKTRETNRTSFKSSQTPKCLPRLVQKTRSLLSQGAQLVRPWTQAGSWMRH